MSVNLSLIGRESELKSLTQHLERAKEGRGSTVLLSGEAGIGKTRLVQEFKEHADEEDFIVLDGAALSDVSHPFLMISKALENLLDTPLFSEQKFTSFSEIFAINKAGLLVAHASSSEEHMDPDIFAAMLTAIQGYIRDSIDSSGRKIGGLGRLEYGDMKILMEHGDNLFLTAVFKGNEHPDMTARLRSTVSSIEDRHGAVLESWDGDMEKAKPVEEELASLASARFLVRQDFEGLKLENERLRIADQVLEILADKSSEKPLLLILEDLHWADDSSLFVLNYLSRNIRSEKIMIAGTLRPEMSDGLQATMDKMSQEGSYVLMPLIQLGSDSVSSLVEAMHPGHEFPQSFIDHLASACKGNPFFVIELLKQMKEEGN
ncbi:MAG: DUF2791 family P-loop domain-containing protein, partial [Thermoplasmata archaeon]|nr:DUF2791 family P-loop domain-containing protein [Thermoplasmata archaeon]